MTAVRRNCDVLTRMKDLAQNGMLEEMLKSLWLQRLQVQTILTTTKHELEELLRLPDRITDMRWR